MTREALVGTLLVAFAAAGASPVELTRADVDLARCESFADRQRQPVAADVALGVLGLVPLDRPWQAGRRRGREEEPEFRYVIALKRPVAVQSLFVVARSRNLFVLTDGAPYPADPLDDREWTRLDVPPGQSGAALVTFPRAVAIRAMLIVDRPPHGASWLEAIRFVPGRLHNVAPLADAFAESERIRYSQGAPPYTYYASRPVRGTGTWENIGPDKKGLTTRPPISDVHPSWYMLAWRKPQKLTGLWLRGNLGDVKLAQFAGGPTINPRAGTDQEWKAIREFRTEVDAHGHWVWFEPLTTRGIRIQILKTNDPNPAVARIEGLHAFVDLGDTPVPVTRGPDDAEAASPVQVPYRIEVDDATVTMVVNREDGTRVRNLITRVAREAGEHHEPWDLADEGGQFVSPGRYQWQAIYHPPLELRYQMTPYPNVVDNTPENSPWLNGHHGPGGWLADHTPNRAVCTVGDRVYLGSPVAESGVSLIETDPDGRKLWGYHSFAGFTGVWHLATDGQTVFIAASARNMAGDAGIDPRSEAVWGIDVASKERRTVALLQPKANRDRGIQGIAAHDGELFASVRAPANILANALGGEDVDIVSCLPKYKPKRKPRYNHEIVPDPRGDFLRLLRLQGTPPGYNTIGLTWLESTEGRGNRQHVVAAFRKPVPIGSVIHPRPESKDIRVKLSVLKPDAPYPPDPDDRSHWLPFAEDATLPWDVALAPPDTLTRALRVTFVKGEDDIFSELGGDDFGTELDGGLGKGSGDALLGDGRNWKGKLEGMKIRRRRFRNLLSEAKVRVSSGVVDKHGVWDAKRDRPLTEAEPAIYALEWPAPVKLRALAIKEMDGEIARVDVFTGPGNAPVDLSADGDWEEMATYKQERRDLHSGFQSYNGTARYMDGYVEFPTEAETRAVRIRVVKQWSDHGNRSDFGDRADRYAKELDPARCHLYGVAPLAYVGGEVPVDSLIAERIEVVDGMSGTVVEEIAVEQPGDIAIGPDGTLFAVSANRVVQIDRDAGENEALVTDLRKAGPLAVDAESNLYVYDDAPDRKRVRVYDRTGKFIRTVGSPGGHHPGPWEPSAMDAVSDIAVDARGQLWIVEYFYWPKRIAVFARDGTFVREFVGPTAYGGGGVLDPWDKTRMFYGPLEFELNWETGRTRLRSFTVDREAAWSAGELPIRIDGRTYLVTRARSSRPSQACGVVWLYEEGRARLVAAVGRADQFFAFKDPKVHARLGFADLTVHRFTWSDRNGDAAVQRDEVRLTPDARGKHGLTQFNRDLGAQMGKTRFEVKEFLANGVPVYEETDYSALPGGDAFPWYRLDDGALHRMKHLGAREPEGVFTPEGEMVWTYPSEQPGTHGYARGGPYHPGQVLGQYGIIAHETAHAGDLGEFFLYSGNTGTWHLWTADGLLAGRLFTDLRARGARHWSFREHERGLPLDGVTIGQEHFSGYFCRSFADDRYYAVAGHNHASVVEVIGIDRFRRIGGTIEVTPDDIARTLAWQQTQARDDVYERAPVVEAFRATKTPRPDADLADWPGDPSARILGGSEEDPVAEFYVAFDDKHLYFAFETYRLGPIRNTGQQWQRLFKTGAAVDLQFSTVDDAPEARRAPVEGDQRLLMTWVGDTPVAVLYRAVVPGTPDGDRWQVVSPVARVTFDRVDRLDSVHLARAETGHGYIVEGAVTLASLGLELHDGMRIKFDWGMVVTDTEANQVLRRVYWANQATGIVADAPSEARLHPNLWGHLIFRDTARDQATREATLEMTPGGEDEILDDFLKEVNDELE